ncbi:BCCT family transporter, partial [Escherichia coli]|nr:BCCT family transporter [Escherichia coli]
MEGTTSHKVAKFNWLCGVNRNAWWLSWSPFVGMFIARVS